MIRIMMIYSVSAGPNLQLGTDDPFSLVERHLQMLVVGFAVLFIFPRLDYHILLRNAVPLMGLTVVLLAALLVFGPKVEGARRWLLGPSISARRSCQAGDHYLCGSVVCLQRQKTAESGLWTDSFFHFDWVDCGSLFILEPNYSTALLIASVAFTMFFVAGADIKQFLGAGLSGTAVATLVVTQSAHAMSRLDLLWVEPSKGLNDQSWQMAQTLIALASGGILGKGLGTGGGQYG